MQHGIFQITEHKSYTALGNQIRKERLTLYEVPRRRLHDSRVYWQSISIHIDRLTRNMDTYTPIRPPGG